MVFVSSDNSKNYTRIKNGVNKSGENIKIHKWKYHCIQQKKKKTNKAKDVSKRVSI